MTFRSFKAQTISQRLTEWSRRSRSRRELEDAMRSGYLSDLPFNRTQAQYEANKFFWEP